MSAKPRLTAVLTGFTETDTFNLDWYRRDYEPANLLDAYAGPEESPTLTLLPTLRPSLELEREVFRAAGIVRARGALAVFVEAVQRHGHTFTAAELDELLRRLGNAQFETARRYKAK